MRVLLIELEGLLAQNLREHWSSQAEVTTLTADKLIDQLMAEPADLTVINLELSHGSGFGLVNRVRRMEALEGLRLVVVSEKETQAALDAHRAGPTPADAYVRGEKGTAADLTEKVLAAASQLLPALESLPEVDASALTSVPESEPVDDVLSQAVEGLGGYRVLRRLRDENGGAVFACMDDELGRAVAIKILAPREDSETDVDMQRFLRERRILALISSPYALGVYGAGTTDDGYRYLVRELIVGEDLSALVHREGPLSVDAAIRYSRETARALKHAADMGVIHRDVRPENIYVVDGHAKLARFGSGRLMRDEQDRITQDARMPNQVFTAPERVHGDEDLRSDVYSLGVTLYTLLAGKSPFASARPIDLLTGKLIAPPRPLERDDVPAPVVELLARMMAESPANRPQSYDDIIQALEPATTISAAPVTQREPTGVHGSLRRMPVVEIVQTLEFAHKTAKVTLNLPGNALGRLGFDAGRLTHASTGLDVGEDAFFLLVNATEGVFDVSYGACDLDENISTPATGLLLEAARRSDEAAPDPPAVDESGFFQQAETSSSEAFDDDDDLEVRPQRRVNTWIGFALVAAAAGLAVYGGLQQSVWPPEVPPDDVSMLSGLIEGQREKIGKYKDELEAARPKLAQLAAAEAAANAMEAERRVIAQAAFENLSAALASDLKSRAIRMRLADDQSGVVIEANELSLFGGARDQLSEDGRSLLARVTGAIAALEKVVVRVEGHSDNTVPAAATGYRNSWGYTGAQAMAVEVYLADQGLSRARLSSVAKGGAAPIESNRGPRGRARNRRVELHLVVENTL